MTSEARGPQTGNTDFSIARILADDSPGADVDIDIDVDAARKRRESPGRRNSPPSWWNRTEEAGERISSWGILRAEGDKAPLSDDQDTMQRGQADLTWLQYTRYRPPRLPRRSLAPERRIKRRAGDHPRIPFSSFQLQVLEDRYRKSAYLSRSDVVEMSAMLRLPQSKIKIWFQNRRARQRRESLNSTIAAR